MGGQGILMRKVSVDKTMNQLTVFLKGSTIICLLYILNGWFIQKNLTIKDITKLVPMYAILIIGFSILTLLKKRGHNDPLLKEIYETFQINRFEEIKKLDQKLVKQVKKERKFISNSGQIVGTTDYLLVDFRDGQFQLLPVKALKSVTMNVSNKQWVATILLQHKSVQLFFKNKKDANELIDNLKKHYAL